MKRREFLRQSGLVLATSAVWSSSRVRAEERSKPSAEKMKRIGCTTVCFRTRFPRTRPKGYRESEPELSLLDIPNLFAEKLGVHNVELWSLHFAEQSSAYCSKIRRAMEKAGSTLCNIQMDEPGYNLSHPSEAERRKSVRLCKDWMDRAAECGATSMRANTGGARKGSPFVLNDTADSYALLAEHGRKIGVKILIENHGGFSVSPERVVSIVKAVDSPWCRTLPDFGNMPKGFSQRQREEFLDKMFSFAHLVSAKGIEFDAQYHHTTYDIGRCVQLGESRGFQGIYSVEQWSPTYIPSDPFQAVRSIIADLASAL